MIAPYTARDIETHRAIVIEKRAQIDAGRPIEGADWLEQIKRLIATVDHLAQQLSEKTHGLTVAQNTLVTRADKLNRYEHAFNALDAPAQRFAFRHRAKRDTSTAACDLARLVCELIGVDLGAQSKPSK